MIRAEEIARKVRSQRFLANEDCYKLIELAGMKKELEEICEFDVSNFTYEGALTNLGAEAAKRLGVDIDWKPEFLGEAREAYKAAGMERSDEEIMEDYFRNDLEKSENEFWFNNGDKEWIYNIKTGEIQK